LDITLPFAYKNKLFIFYINKVFGSVQKRLLVGEIHLRYPIRIL